MKACSKAFTRYEPGFIKRPYLGYMVRQDWLDKLADGLRPTDYRIATK